MSINLTDAPDDDDSYPPAYRELVEPSQPTPKAIRQWALETGLQVGKRGRIPADVELAYMQARQS
jgi:hypothetical protein